MKVSRLKIRKSLFIVLFGLLTMLLVMVCSFSIKEQIDDLDSWQYNATYDFETKIETNNDGEEEFVMYVKTPEQLAGAMNLFSKSSKYINTNKQSRSLFSHMDSLPNSTIKLTSNMDFGGGDWGQQRFSGNLDGQGYVISNLNVSRGDPAGFVISNYGTIQNLVISNIKVNSTSSGSDVWVGGVAGYNSGTIRNVSIVGKSYVNGVKSGRTGGIVGYNDGTIEKCINYAEVTNGENIGGIAGYSSHSITRCFNHGHINEGYEPSISIGGIVGYIDKGTVSYCENTAYIRGVTSPNGYVWVGGIAGKSYVDITKCGNTGNVRSGDYDAITAYGGGIAGYIFNGADISYCYNRGDVTGSAKDRTEDEGYLNYFGETKFGKEGHYTLFIADAEYPHLDRGYYKNIKRKSYKNNSGVRCFLGGIVGWTDSNTHLSYSYNTGKIDNNGPLTRTIVQYAKWDAYYYHHWWFFGDHYDIHSDSHLMLETEVKYDYLYTFSPISPSPNSSSSSCYNYYYNYVPSSKSLSFEAKQWVYAECQPYRYNADKTFTLSGWNNTNGSWYYGWYGWSYKFNTEHGVYASDPSCIRLTAAYENRNVTTYRYLYTGLNSSTFYMKNCDGSMWGQSNIFGGVTWTRKDGINGGWPYINDMYWK